MSLELPAWWTSTGEGSDIEGGTRSLSRLVRLWTVEEAAMYPSLLSIVQRPQRMSSVAATWIWGKILGQVESFRASLDSAFSMQVSGPRGSAYM